MEAELDGTRIFFKPKVVVDKGAVRPAAAAAEHQAWGKLAVQQLDKAYGPGEPDYSQSLIKEPNPEFKP